MLWRRAAFWVLTVAPGDILLLTGTGSNYDVMIQTCTPLRLLEIDWWSRFLSGLRVNEDRWRGETVLQSTFSSKLLNLGPITTSSSPPGTNTTLNLCFCHPLCPGLSIRGCSHTAHPDCAVFKHNCPPTTLASAAHSHTIPL